MISNGSMRVNPFSPELLNTIENSIEEIKARFQPPYIAAFDADGTLWSTDAGNLLYFYQVENNLLETPSKELEAKYHDFLRNGKNRDLCLWQAELNGHLDVNTVNHWIQKSQEDVIEKCVFRCQQNLIEKLQRSGFDVYIVSASFLPTIVPAAKTLFNIPPENVVAVTIDVENDVYQPQISGAFTSHEGKVQRLLETTGGVHPVFCVGNTMSDLPLLESSQHFRLAVRAVSHGHVNFNSEESLAKVAEEKNWPQHHF